MLCSLQGNVQIVSLSLCGKHPNQPQKENGTNFQDVAQKIQYNKNQTLVRITLLNILTQNWPHNSVVK